MNNGDIDIPAIESDNLKKIWLPTLAVFSSDIIGKLLTKQIINELTEVKGHRCRVIVGQRVSNIFSACFGGINGSASIGQCIFTNHSDGITSLYTFLTGAFMAVFVYTVFDFVDLIPLGAIAGIMSWMAL